MALSFDAQSFGNAKTLLSDNSSRFGKFLQIQFDAQATIVGAHVQNFLLERTRVVSQAPGERNFHVFFQLLEGADEHRRSSLQLQVEGAGAEDDGVVASFAYLSSALEAEDEAPSAHVIAGRSDGGDFPLTLSCLGEIGLDESEVGAVLSILSAILHLGNIEFADVDGDHSAVLSGTSAPAAAAKLLEVAETDLCNALCYQRHHVKNEVTSQPQTASQARRKRDSLAKAVYSDLFVWLVQRLNSTISAPTRQNAFIGVLDICSSAPSPRYCCGRRHLRVIVPFCASCVRRRVRGV